MGLMVSPVVTVCSAFSAVAGLFKGTCFSLSLSSVKILKEVEKNSGVPSGDRGRTQTALSFLSLTSKVSEKEDSSCTTLNANKQLVGHQELFDAVY